MGSINGSIFRITRRKLYIKRRSMGLTFGVKGTLKEGQKWVEKD